MAGAPSESEIDSVLNTAQAYQDKGQNPYPGMTYLEGVINGIRWAKGDDDDSPTSELDPEADGVFEL